MKVYAVVDDNGKVLAFYSERDKAGSAHSRGRIEVWSKDKFILYLDNKLPGHIREYKDGEKCN
tara:strand:+ start:649 stop:837 length:189 start_codon:yes stop_codon:yes gene_type:complete